MNDDDLLRDRKEIALAIVARYALADNATAKLAATMRELEPIGDLHFPSFETNEQLLKFLCNRSGVKALRGASLDTTMVESPARNLGGVH